MSDLTDQLDATLALMRSDVSNFETAFHAAKAAVIALHTKAEAAVDDELHRVVDVLSEALEKMASNPLTHISTPALPASGEPVASPGIAANVGAPPTTPGEGETPVAPTGDPVPGQPTAGVQDGPPAGETPPLGGTTPPEPNPI